MYTYNISGKTQKFIRNLAGYHYFPNSSSAFYQQMYLGYRNVYWEMFLAQQQVSILIQQGPHHPCHPARKNYRSLQPAE